MTTTTNVFEINPIIFTADYIISNLLPVVQQPSEDDSLLKESFLDLELIFKVILKDDEEGTTTYRLTKALSEKAGLDMEYLKHCAKEIATDSITCQSMGEIFGIPDDALKMNVLSNKSRNLGAGLPFLCTDVLKDLAETWQSNEIIILPSSIHELIAIPSDMADSEYINQMIASVNADVVSEKERLADHFYVYHADSDCFTY